MVEFGAFVPFAKQDKAGSGESTGEMHRNRTITNDKVAGRDEARGLSQTQLSTEIETSMAELSWQICDAYPCHVVFSTDYSNLMLGVL